MKNSISSGFPFESKFMEVKGSKMHYIDEGKGDPILFLHGNPASSYIWRNIIPHVTKNARAIAVDLIGFGKSDKPNIKYGFKDQYDYLEAFLNKLDLKNITIVVQDWGSGLGFHFANQHRDKIKGIVFMEAMFKEKKWEEMPGKVQKAMKLIKSKFFSWLVLGVANQFVKKMLPDGVKRKLSDEEMKYYTAPFKTLKSRRPVYVFPRDVPVSGTPEASSKAVNDYHEWLKMTDIPKLGFYVDPGMLISVEEAKWIESNFPNTEMVYLGEGSHFVQEDYPHEIGTKISDWYQTINLKQA